MCHFGARIRGEGCTDQLFQLEGQLLSPHDVLGAANEHSCQPDLSMNQMRIKSRVAGIPMRIPCRSLKWLLAAFHCIGCCDVGEKRGHIRINELVAATKLCAITPRDGFRKRCRRKHIVVRQDNTGDLSQTSVRVSPSLPHLF